MNLKYKNEIELRKKLCFPFWKIRLFVKYILLKFNIRNISFCKECGIDVRDFNASNEEWNKVQSISKNKNILCWNCYCDYLYLFRSYGGSDIFSE